jgi:hypothetical protein
MVETTQKTIKYPEFKELFNVFIRYCLSQYKLILLLIILGGVIGLIYGKSQSPNYVGVSTFIIEDKSGSRGGGISGLASQCGIDVASLTGGGAGLFEGENIFEIMKACYPFCLYQNTRKNQKQIGIKKDPFFNGSQCFHLVTLSIDKRLDQASHNKCK